MITLFNFGKFGGLNDLSPFCLKLEAYLKMSAIPFEVKSGQKYLMKAPKGKLPYITDEGETIADSALIIEYLREKYGNTLDGWLSDEQRAIAHGFNKMIDENLYWTMVHSRWMLDHNWMILKKLFFGGFPFPLNKIIAPRVRKGVKKALYEHGIGRHSNAEIFEIGQRDLQALSDFLGQKEYFFGDQPSALDANAYGILAEFILLPDFTSPLMECAKSYENLVEFTDRVHGRYFTG